MKISNMNKFSKILIFLACAAVFSIFLGRESLAQVPDSASDTQVFLSPRSGGFIFGTTFEVSIFVNTNKNKIDGLNLKINYDKNKLSIVEPSGGRSIVSSWTKSPSYDNTRGEVTYIGTMDEGLVTDSGLVATITFKSLGTGSAPVSINSSSFITLDDGLSTKA